MSNLNSNREIATFLLLFSLVQPAFGQLIETTPDRNAFLKGWIGYNFGVHITGSAAGFYPAPIPPIGIIGEIAAYSSDLTLKSTPASFERIPDKTITSGGCTKEFDMDMVSATRGNMLGFTFKPLPGARGPDLGIDDREWGFLVDQEEMKVWHLNTDVQVSVSNPNIVPKSNRSEKCDDRLERNDSECFHVTLREGKHDFLWEAGTQLAPFGDVIVPSVLLTVTLYSEVKKLKEFSNLVKGKNSVGEIVKRATGKNGEGGTIFMDPEVAEATKKSFEAGILELQRRPKLWGHIKKKLKDKKTRGGKGAGTIVEFLRESKITAVNRFTQTVTLFDTHSPTISPLVSNVELEATDLGGTRLVRAMDKLTSSFQYDDPCGNELYLTNDAPNILPLGPGVINWNVTDVLKGQEQRHPYADGFDSFATLSQSYTVLDRQPPIIVAPSGKVVESDDDQVDPTNLDLGWPLVIDLADPAPVISNDAPAIFENDTRLSINWTATDSSGNGATQVQWVTAKTPNSNTAPTTENVRVVTRTAELVEIRLDGIDGDVLPTSRGFDLADPLSFEIVDYPDNGQFEAPLRPFFVEDFRLTPVGETEVKGARTSPLGDNAAEFAALPDPDDSRTANQQRGDFLSERYCDVGQPIPLNFVFQPTYVHVADDGTYFVRDKYWDCEKNLSNPPDRLSKWSKDRGFLAEFRLDDLFRVRPSPIFTVDADGNIWWTDEGPLIGIRSPTQEINKVDANFENYEKARFDVPWGSGGTDKSLLAVHADPLDELIFVNTNLGIDVYSFDDALIANTPAIGRLNINGNEEFLTPVTPLVKGDVPGPNEPSCREGLRDGRYATEDRYWIATDSRSNLYMSDACEDLIHKFESSSIGSDGNLVPGEYVGWLGRCDANIPPWNGCDEAKGVTHGFTCANDKCTRSQLSGDAPGQFYLPTHISIDRNDILYVSDYLNLRVQRFGIEGTFAGQAKSTGSGINVGEDPGFVLGNMGEPRSTSVNSSSFYVMEYANDADFFLHSFKTIPFHMIEAKDGEIDQDDDGYADNSVLLKYTSDYNFPGTTGADAATDVFKYRVNDGLVDSKKYTGRIRVRRNYRPPEQLDMQCFEKSEPDLPVKCELLEDTDLLLKFISEDPDGIIGFDGLDTLAYTPGSSSLGTLTLQRFDAASATYLFVPDPDVNGMETVAFSVTDNTTLEKKKPVEVSAQFDLSIIPVPDRPVLTIDEFSVAGRGFTTAVTASYTDADEDPDEPPPTLDVNWGDGRIEAQGAIVEDANGEFMVTGPLLTPTTPGQGFVQGMQLFQSNGNRSVTVCLQPSDFPEPVCEERLIEVIDATNVTVLVTPLSIDEMPVIGTVYTYNIQITNQVPETWDGLNAKDVEVLVDIPPMMFPFIASPDCIPSINLMQYRCVIGDMQPGDVINFQVRMLINPYSVPRPDVTLKGAVSHQSVDISEAITSASVLLIDWPDSDADGLPDRWEILLFGSLTATSGDDADADGLSNIDEYYAVTDPFQRDTDGDGLDDFAEVNDHSTNPNSVDTDGDSLPDLWEVQSGIDPNSIEDSREDPDEDGLLTVNEYEYGTDPQNPDTDADTALDGSDNCPLLQNRHQLDFDGDGFGKVCDEYSVVDIAALGSMTGTAAPLVAVLQTIQTIGKLNTDRSSEVRMIDAIGGATVDRFEPFDSDWTIQDLTPIPEMMAIGISATRDDDGLIAMEIVDAISTNIISTLYPFEPGWRLLDAVALTDPAGSGFTAMAALGFQEQSGLTSVDIEDLDSNSLLQDRRIDYFAELGSQYTPQSLIALRHDEREVLVVIAKNDVDDTTMIQARFADDGSHISNMIALDSSWTFIQAIAANDLDNDGIDKLAVLMRRNSDNLTTVMVIDIALGDAVRQLLLDNAVATDWRAEAIQLIGGGTNAAFGILMTNDPSGMTQVLVADALTGETRQIADYGPENYRYRQAFSTVSDTNGNGVPDLAVISEQEGDGTHRLQISDADTGAIVRMVSLRFGPEPNPDVPRKRTGGGVFGPLAVWILFWLILASYRARKNSRPRQI